jgi:hypothetical protein
MKEFFRGWRRKARCVALVFSVTLTAVWFRSYWIRDEVIFPQSNSVHALDSSHGGLQWEWHRPFLGYDCQRSIYWTSRQVDKFDDSIPLVLSDDTYWSGAGFSYHVPQHGTSATWRAPFWSLVLPLTLVSAYLILWKSRVRQAGAGATGSPG